MKSLFRIFRKSNQDESVFVVSGLPRSGTSMMMKMLEAGGLQPVSDNLRTADDDNPKGYYEFERVKKLPEGDNSWLPEARGKVVKVISALLENLPKEYAYKVIFMNRQMDEILASQRQMLIRSNKPTDKVSDEQLAEMYRKHIAKVDAWLKAQPNISVLYVDYNQMLADPRASIDKINAFLDELMDIEKMADIVDLSLYRQRK
ncbi:MAG TPA: sulfotransferase [Anaerolineales bacterium]